MAYRFRWLSCQILVLRDCLASGHLRRALDELPGTLDETYERILQGNGEANWENAHRLLQCVAVASRPLCARELAEFLAFDFTSRPIPKFQADLRPQDPLYAILFTCSSLFTVVNVDRSSAIQFSHFSVKKFLTSGRLASARETISRYDVHTTLAHTTVAQACLAVLLQLDVSVTRASVEDSPLASYAAKYWADHAQFGGVSPSIQDGMKRLFDPSRPHFAIWVWIYDIIKMRPSPTNSPSQPTATPLHCAAFCGFRDVAQYLVDIRPREGVNDRDDCNRTPLHVASTRRYGGVTGPLVEHRADGTTQKGHNNQTQLDRTSEEGQLGVASVLLMHGADVNARDNCDRTPLHLASSEGNLEVAQLLLGHHADPSARDNDSWTPLHWASDGQHLELVRVLLRYRADSNARDARDKTPLHWASLLGHLNVAQLLVEYGADPNAQDACKQTPLHFASIAEDPEFVLVLLKHGAEANALDSSNQSPLYLASKNERLKAARALLQYGANPNVEDYNHSTPLHVASQEGYLDIARILLEHGAKPNVWDDDNWTPLHWASLYGHFKIVRILLKHGADANARDDENRTPLHWASREGVARILLVHGADANVLDNDGFTPSQMASQEGYLEVAQVLHDHQTTTW